MRKLLESFRKQGYTPKYGFSEGYFLVNSKGDWVFYIISGQHRIATMAELGFQHVPVQLFPTSKRVIRSDKVEDWPMVVNGQLSQEEAISIFDSFFSKDRELIFANV